MDSPRHIKTGTLVVTFTATVHSRVVCDGHDVTVGWGEMKVVVDVSLVSVAHLAHGLVIHCVLEVFMVGGHFALRQELNHSCTKSMLSLLKSSHM